MIEALLPFSEEIKRETQDWESVEDLAKMIEIIASSRQDHIKGSFEEHVAVALIVGCARPHIGKTPDYEKKVRKYRKKFIGISQSPFKQKAFSNSLLKPLLSEPLEKLDFSTIDNLFKDEMEEKSEADISELIQLMFVGLMGANNEINKVLKAFHEIHDKPNHGFLFYEFLVHQPLYKKPPTGSFNNTWIFSPFPHRLARRSLVMTEEQIAKNEILINMAIDQFTQRLYKFWKNENDKDVNIMDILNLELVPLKTPFIDPQEFYNPFFVKVLDYTTNKMKTLYGKLSSTADDISKKSFVTLERLRGPLLGDENEVTSLLIPIASSEIFYGDLMVLLPYFKKTEYANKIEYENKLEQLASKLLTCIKKHYVPALALIHEHFFENLISKQKNIGISELMDQYDVWLHNDKIEGSYNSPICRRATMDSKLYITH